MDAKTDSVKTDAILFIVDHASEPMSEHDLYWALTDVGLYPGEPEKRAKCDIRLRLELLEAKKLIAFKRKPDGRNGWVSTGKKTDGGSVTFAMDKDHAVMAKKVLDALSPWMDSTVAVHLDRLRSSMVIEEKA